MLDLIGLCTGSRVMDLRIFPNDSEGIFLTIFHCVWLESLFIVLYISRNESVLKRMDL